MARDFSFIDIAAIVKELQALVDGKVDNIYQTSGDEVYISIFKTGLGKKLIRITPSIIYISSFKGESKDSGFCKFLRRRLKNSFLRKVELKDSERIVIFEFETKEAKLNLIVELFSKGNIILCDSDFKIISPLKQQKWRDRDILPKREYKFPPSSELNFFDLNLKKFKELIGKKEIVKVLAKDLGLGRFYAEKICEILGIDKNIKKPQKVENLFKELDKLKKLNIEANEIKKEILPFKFEKIEKKFKTFNDALDEYFREDLAKEERGEISEEFEKELKRLKNIKKKQEGHLKKLKNTAEKDKIKGDLIYNNYQKLEEIIKVIKKARDKKTPWKEIKEKLATKNIKVNTKEGTISLNLK